MDARRYKILRCLAVGWIERGKSRPIDGSVQALDAGTALGEALDGYDEVIVSVGEVGKEARKELVEPGKEVARLKAQVTALVDGQNDLRKREAQVRRDLEDMDLARREALQHRDRAMDALAAAERACREEHQAALDCHRKAMVQGEQADKAELDRDGCAEGHRMAEDRIVRLTEGAKAERAARDTVERERDAAVAERDALARVVLAVVAGTEDGEAPDGHWPMVRWEVDECVWTACRDLDASSTEHLTLPTALRALGDKDAARVVKQIVTGTAKAKEVDHG